MIVITVLVMLIALVLCILAIRFILNLEEMQIDTKSKNGSIAGVCIFGIAVFVQSIVQLNRSKKRIGWSRKATLLPFIPDQELAI